MLWPPVERLVLRPSKVFGIGLNKTGTTTLATCLQTLGYDHLSLRRDLLELYRQGRLDEIFSIIDRFQSFEDWPYPLMYRELDAHYGDHAKFILTVRRDPDTWLRSLKAHAIWAPPLRHCRKLAYGRRYPQYSAAHHLAFYDRHNREVVEYFQSRGAGDRLLVVCWDTGDGWGKLCGFLGCEIPDAPFPIANASAERQPSGNELANRVLCALYGALSAIPCASVLA